MIQVSHENWMQLCDLIKNLIPLTNYNVIYSPNCPFEELNSSSSPYILTIFLNEPASEVDWDLRVFILPSRKVTCTLHKLLQLYFLSRFLLINFVIISLNNWFEGMNSLWLMSLFFENLNITIFWKKNYFIYYIHEVVYRPNGTGPTPKVMGWIS